MMMNLALWIVTFSLWVLSSSAYGAEGDARQRQLLLENFRLRLNRFEVLHAQGEHAAVAIEIEACP